MLSLRNSIALVLIIASLSCLYLGLTQDILSLSVAAKLPLVGTLNLYDSTQSILKTIETLYKNSNELVAFLILLFSVIIPLIKAFSLLLIFFVKSLNDSYAFKNFIAIISKWSMADVFLVGIFLAFLSTSSEDAINATLGTGFYWFLAYCILSILASQVIETKKR